MERDEKTQNEASQAVITLRKALGMTQQAFANHIKTAVTTVARWETSNPPPRGETLLNLADVAWEAGLPMLSDKFQQLFFDEFIPRLRPKGLKVRREDGSGYDIRVYDALAKEGRR